MARRDKTAELIQGLRQAARAPDSPESVATVEEGLKSEIAMVVERAAEVARLTGSPSLVSHLSAAFRRFVENPDRDQGCAVKLALLLALEKFAGSSDEAFLTACRYKQLEWGLDRPIDTADTLRATAIVALAQAGHRSTHEEAIRLLHDAEPRARIGAMQALVAFGTDASGLVLKYHALSDEFGEAWSECLAGLLRLDQGNLAFVAEFLDHQDPGRAALAALALGESRYPDAFPYLRDCWLQRRDSQVGEDLLLAVASLHNDEAIDYLVQVVRDGDRIYASDALSALSIYRSDADIRARVQAAVTDSASRDLAAKFAKLFP